MDTISIEQFLDKLRNSLVLKFNSLDLSNFGEYCITKNKPICQGFWDWVNSYVDFINIRS